MYIPPLSVHGERVPKLQSRRRRWPAPFRVLRVDARLGKRTAPSSTHVAAPAQDPASERSRTVPRPPGGRPPEEADGVNYILPLDVPLSAALACSVVPPTFADAPSMVVMGFHMAEWVTEHVHTTPQCPW